MGITERHLFEDEEPELTERQLQDAVEERETARIDIPRIDIPKIETMKIKRQLLVSATRCLVCGKWECPKIDHEIYDVLITGETSGICESCRKAIEWAKEQIMGR